MLNLNAKRKTWWKEIMMEEVPYACFVSPILHFPILISFVVLISQGTIIHVVTEVYWRIIVICVVIYKTSDGLFLISLLLPFP